LTLPLEDQCIEIKLKDQHMSYYHFSSLYSLPFRKSIIIWSALINYLSNLRIFHMIDSLLTLTTWYSSSIWFQDFNRVRIVPSKKSHKSIHPPNNLKTIFPFLKILCLDHSSTWFINHFTHHTSLKDQIFKL